MKRQDGFYETGGVIMLPNQAIIPPSSHSYTFLK